MSSKNFANLLWIDPVTVKSVSIYPVQCAEKTGEFEDQPAIYHAMLFLHDGTELPCAAESARALIEHLAEKGK